MPTVKNILDEFSHPIPSVDPQATVTDAAKLMNQFKVGALVVCEEEKCIGILTERDLIRGMALSPNNLLAAHVSTVMTRDPLACLPELDILEARRLMVLKRIHNLPVIDRDRRAIGLLSLVDLNAHDFKGQQIEIKHLKNYIYGRN